MGDAFFVTIILVHKSKGGKTRAVKSEQYGYVTYQNFLQEETLKKDNWAIFDKSILGITGIWKDEADLKRDLDRGFVVKAASLEELAEKIQVPLASLRATINTLNVNQQVLDNQGQIIPGLHAGRKASMVIAQQ